MSAPSYFIDNIEYKFFYNTPFEASVNAVTEHYAKIARYGSIKDLLIFIKPYLNYINKINSTKMWSGYTPIEYIKENYDIEDYDIKKIILSQ